VNAPFEWLALPAKPTEPTSWSNQVFGNGCDVTVKTTGLLSFMPGAAETTKGPEVAPDRMVMLMEVALQVLMVTGDPFSSTTLLACVAPKFDPLIVT
jgi:hypothetical protein